MTRTTRSITIAVPIPSSIPPQKILEALHAHIPIFRAQAFVTSVQPVETDLPSVLEDSFFVENGLKIRSYAVTENVPIIPGLWSTEVKFTAVCQDQEDGVRAKADAPAGVVVRSIYHVAPRAEGGGYELSSTTSVESHVLLIAFVSRSMEEAHRELCQKVVDGVESEINGKRGGQGHT